MVLCTTLSGFIHNSRSVRTHIWRRGGLCLASQLAPQGFHLGLELNAPLAFGVECRLSLNGTVFRSHGSVLRVRGSVLGLDRALLSLSRAFFGTTRVLFGFSPSREQHALGWIEYTQSIV